LTRASIRGKPFSTLPRMICEFGTQQMRGSWRSVLIKASSNALSVKRGHRRVRWFLITTITRLRLLTIGLKLLQRKIANFRGLAPGAPLETSSQTTAWQSIEDGGGSNRRRDEPIQEFHDVASRPKRKYTRHPKVRLLLQPQVIRRANAMDRLTYLLKQKDRNQPQPPVTGYVLFSNGELPCPLRMPSAVTWVN
jgi:hypothetical protein